MSSISARGPDGVSRSAATTAARSLLNALLMAGVPVRHDCGGLARCGTCRVRVEGGGRGLSPVAAGEAERLAALGADPRDRLACQARASRDVSVEILDDGAAGREGLGGHRGAGA